MKSRPSPAEFQPRLENVVRAVYAALGVRADKSLERANEAVLTHRAIWRPRKQRATVERNDGRPNLCENRRPRTRAGGFAPYGGIAFYKNLNRELANSEHRNVRDRSPPRNPYEAK